MRWDNLFDDLESQLEHEMGAEDVDLRAEEERLRRGRLGLRDRLMAIANIDRSHIESSRMSRAAASSDTTRMPHSTDAEHFVISILLVSGQSISVLPDTFGKDWLAAELFDESHRRSHCVLALAAIAGVMPTRDQLLVSTDDENTAAEGSRVVDRIGFPFVLRDLCRRRAAIEIHTRLGPFFGTIDRVGRDHLDLAVHEPGSIRREANVSHYLIVPIEQILFVRL